jgi:hypothetical protein
VDVVTRVDYFRKEHQDFLHFLGDWESALDVAASQDEQQVVLGLERLRALQPQLQALREHCASEELNIEAPYHAYLEQGQIEALRAEHQHMARLLSDLFSELRFATLYQTEPARAAGHRLAEFTRQHILFEEKLLAEIEKKLAQEAEENLLLRYTQAPE